MTTNCLYFLSNDLVSEAKILESGQDEKGHYIICDQTIFHAQGGGQKSDRGDIDGVEVLSVAKRGTPKDFDVMHYLAAVLPKPIGQTVFMNVNAEARALHSRLHTLGHLLAHAVDEAYPDLKAVQGHHWPGESRVEFMVANNNTPPDEAHINTVLAQLIAADLPIVCAVSEAGDRTVQIGNYEAVPCGGTHLLSTRELVSGTARGIKIKADRARISYE